VPAVFLVGDVLGVADGGDDPDVGEVTVQHGDQVPVAPLHHGRDGGGTGVARASEPVGVLPADCFGQMVGTAELVDGASSP